MAGPVGTRSGLPLTPNSTAGGFVDTLRLPGFRTVDCGGNSFTCANFVYPVDKDVPRLSSAVHDPHLQQAETRIGQSRFLALYHFIMLGISASGLTLKGFSV